jgi:glycine betaine/proline transport system ATP-binding protein
MSTQAETSTSLEPVIRCDSVYMIFGDNAHSMLEQANGVVDHAKFHEAGCIVGVNNASFEVHKGELLIIMGLSGSGKSTLMRCISRLNEATAGKIYIDGEDILAMNDKQLIELRRNKMGMVFQSFALLPHKTVLENIAFPLQVKGVSTQESMQRAKEMVDLVSLTGRENYCPLARHRTRHLVSRRTLFRARSVDPKGNAGRVSAPAGCPRQDHFIRHP